MSSATSESPSSESVRDQSSTLLPLLPLRGGMYRQRLGSAVAAAWLVVLFGGTVYFSESDTQFSHWGPSDVVFAGFRVDTWPKWGAVMTYSALSQVVYTTVSSTLSPYISNVIRDHKTPRPHKGSSLEVHLLMQVYTLYGWLSSVFDVFLWVTLQLQFILPAVAADAACTALFTRGYLSDSHPSLLEEETVSSHSSCHR